MRKVAIFGGAFNPITLGHIEVANLVLRSALVDEVWLMPAYSHMYHKVMISPEHRLKMIELSTDDPHIKPFDFEIKYGLTGETYKLVDKLLSDPNYKDFEFSFIMGLDNANTFHKWVKYEYLRDTIPFIVVPRTGYHPIKEVDWYLKPPHTYLVSDPLMEISSTDVRNAIKNGESLEGMLHPVVIEYIYKNFLYI